MIRAIACLILSGLLSLAAFGQTTGDGPAFDVADVHVSAKTANPQMNGGGLRGGRYSVQRATMLDLIALAYGVEGDKVLGGPSWLETDRFDIIATAPASTTAETVRQMLQNLLTDRFKLKLHKDTKSVPSFVLSLGKGKHKLKESEGPGNTGCQGQPQTPEPGVIPLNVVSCRNLTTEAIAQTLRQIAGGYVTAPVVDSTGLKGAWDFDIKWTGRGQLAAAGADGISIFDAVDKQLGLKLEPSKVDTSVYIVDSVNEKPTDNAPGVITKLPAAPPAEFEVADIKPSMPDSPQAARFQPGGRLDVQGMPIKTIIQLAWNIGNDDELMAGPKWLDSERFDIIAKAPMSPDAPPDIDALRLMLRALLVDRFKMATHMEDRPVTAYTLIAVKPKLNKADPNNRTSWKEGPAPASTSKDPRDANPALARLVTCTNMTMAQFADALPNIAPGYIHTPVVDASGIEGAFDFTFNFSPIGIFQNGGTGGRGGAPPPPPPGAATASSDPSGAVSLFDALNKQLGLKLDMQKRPLPVLVIDHMEQKPTDN
jgi:uncharacterized protein (TIGR03435 family)